MIMKPIEGFDANQKLKEGKQVFALNTLTLELIHLNKIGNIGFIVNTFSQSHFLYYVYE